MQHPSTHLLTTNSASPPTTTTETTRRSLPPRKHRAETIEDAYVQFILYCNPGVPAETDTAALREAFRIPPKSGGKTFSTYALFGLIEQFQNKEIRTWAELALRLGVDPPDQDKGQSTQKIQQYAVRLKRWMHSMHLDAFFDYMLNNPHPYWTEVPQDLNPITEEGRDGVAAEDDMALRSLLPEIRPRRGRKRPDDEDSSVSPSQRPRMEGGSSTDFGPGTPAAPAGTAQQQQQQHLDLWSAHSDGGSSAALFPPQDQQYARMGMNMSNLGVGVVGVGVSWPGDSFIHTPLTAHPYSALTPSTAGQVLWPDEPRSAVTTHSRPPKTNRRHGAKVVSSAWRSGGPGGSGKTRGRPPLNRQLSSSTNDPSSPFSAFPAQTPGVRQQQQQQQQGHSPHVTPDVSSAMIRPSQSIDTSFGHPQQQGEAQAQARDLRSIRSRLALQVPERTGGGVRLATPPGPQPQAPPGPPVVMINGSAMGGGHQQHVGFGTETAGAGAGAMGGFEAAGGPYVPFPQQQQAYQAAVPPVRAQYGPSSFVGVQPFQGHSPQHPQHQHQHQHQHRLDQHNNEQQRQQRQQQQQQQQQQQPQPQGVQFTDPNDRTNLDEVESLLTYDILSAEWTDAAGQPLPPCGVGEAAGISRQVVEDVMRGAASREAFLVNVAALAGSSVLRSGRSVRVQRVAGVEEGGGDVDGDVDSDGDGDGGGVYDCHWEMRLGDVKGTCSLRVAVGRGRWSWRGREGGDGDGDGDGEEDAEGEEDDDDSGPDEKGVGGGGAGDAERWQRKYRELLGTVQQQRSELSGFRRGMVKLCRPRTGGAPDEGMMGG